MVVATGRGVSVPHQGGPGARARPETVEPRTAAAVQGVLSMLADEGHALATGNAPAVVEVPRPGRGREVVVLVVLLADRSDPRGYATTLAAARSAALAVASGEGGTPRLTVRELEVLGLYASGEKADRVARLLGISRETVLDHVRRIRQKYAAVDRPAHTKVDLYRRAVEDGVLRGRG